MTAIVTKNGNVCEEKLDKIILDLAAGILKAKQ